jgi:hypothetical protein
MYRYKVPRIETRPRESRDEVVIEDPRFALDIVTDAFLNKLRLTNRANVTLSIPLHYDPSTNTFKIPERAQPAQAFAYGRYYGASLPTETVPGDYELAVDPNHRLYVTADKLEAKATPVLKGSVFNTPVSANTNIFASDLTPTNSPTAFRIYACFSAAGVLSVVRTKAGTTVREQMNAGNALNANAAYVFDIVVESGESINLQYSVAATALVLKVVEVPLMAA